MLLIREIMYCKPGKVRLMVETVHRHVASQRESGTRQDARDGGLRRRYWTIVTEFEVPDISAFESMMKGEGMKPELAKEFEKVMDGYHDLVVKGRREIFKIEN
jgi:hypothetical protein